MLRRGSSADICICLDQNPACGPDVGFGKTLPPCERHLLFCGSTLRFQAELAAGALLANRVSAQRPRMLCSRTKGNSPEHSCRQFSLKMEGASTEQLALLRTGKVASSAVTGAPAVSPFPGILDSLQGLPSSIHKPSHDHTSLSEQNDLRVLGLMQRGKYSTSWLQPGRDFWALVALASCSVLAFEKKS